MNRVKKNRNTRFKNKIHKSTYPNKKKKSNQEYKLLYCDHMPKKARDIWGDR